jgi:hypothetical protein
LIDVLRFSLMMIKDYGYRRQMASVLRPSLRTFKSPECLVRLKNLAVRLLFSGCQPLLDSSYFRTATGKACRLLCGFLADF